MRRILAIFVSFLVALNFVWVRPVSAQVDYSKIRVALASMGAPDTVRVIVQGDYGIPERSSIDLEQQKEYTIKLSGGSLVLTDGSQTWSLGSRFTFERRNGNLRVYNNSFGWVNYLGDMEVRIEGNCIRLVNHIHLETYLYGVVPVEMGNDWPDEALRAQAVAARSYAVATMRPGSYYDLKDDQSSQAYLGYYPSRANGIRAVNDTAGEVLKYNGKVAETFYSSSNGGRTEEAKNIFPEDLPYTVIRDDPYDVENPANPCASWTVSYSRSPVDTSLSNRLTERIKSSLAARGYSVANSDIRIKSIKELSVHRNDSGRVDSGRIVIVLDAKRTANGQFETIEEAVALTKSNARSILNVKSLLLTVEDTGSSYLIRGGGNGHGVGMSQFGAQYMAFLGFDYDKILDFYYPGTELSRLDVGTSPDTPPDEDEEPEPGKTTRPFPRPGRTSPTEKPGTTGKPTPTPEPTQKPFPRPGQSSPTEEPSSSPAPTSGQTSKPFPRPSSQPTPTRTPTPAKTPAPAVKPTAKPAASPSPAPSPTYGRVKVSTTLNVRQNAGTQYPIVGSLTDNTRVEILAQSGQWYQVRTGSLTGFVSKDYVTPEQSTRPTQPSGGAGGNPATPPTDTAPPPIQKRIGIVTATSLYVRTGAGTNHRALGYLPHNSKVEVLGMMGEWYQIRSGSLSGYVHGDYIKLQ